MLPSHNCNSLVMSRNHHFPFPILELLHSFYFHVCHVSFWVEGVAYTSCLELRTHRHLFSALQTGYDYVEPCTNWAVRSKILQWQHASNSLCWWVMFVITLANAMCAHRELHHHPFYSKCCPYVHGSGADNLGLCDLSAVSLKKKKYLTPFLIDHWLTIAIQLKVGILWTLLPSMLAYGVVWPSACLVQASIPLWVHILLRPRLAILLLVFFSLYFCFKLSSSLLCWVICIFLASHCSSDINCIFLLFLSIPLCV